MRLVVLHATFIFFSVLFLMVYWEILSIISIVFSLVALFLVFLAMGRLYGFNLRRTVALSTSITLLLTSIVVICALMLPLMVIAVSILDMFFVSQTLLWIIALRPIILSGTFANHTSIKYVYVLSLTVAILSLITSYILVYGALYLLFCLIIYRFMSKKIQQ